MPSDFLKRSQIIQLNQACLANLTEHHAVTNEVALLSIVGRPQRGFFDGTLCFPTIPAQAAVLAHAVTTYHAFEQGNKRTALGALQIFLSRNGYLLMANEDEKVGFILSIAKADISTEDAIKWVQDRAVPLDGV